MRRAATWRPLFLQHSCQFCCGGSPQVLPEHGSHGLQQSTSPAESCKLGKELGLILRKTHNKLRSDLRQGREFKEVWSEHSSNITDLSEYAATMVSMAQHWETKDTSLKARNTWIEAQVRCYYNRRSNLAMLQEEMRRARLDLALLTPLQQELLMKLQPTLNAHWKQQMQKDLRDLHAGPEDPKRPDETTNDGQSVKGAATGSENVTHVSSSLPQALVYSDGSCATGQLHAVNRVRVLDVGSCYNPLGRYPHLLVTPIDLMPATQDVYKCDFLDVKVVNASEGCDLPPVEGQDAGVDRKIERLPSNYYDVVVFSLVLDYIPCPEARLRCCRKAHQLLRPGGLLLIVTPSCCSGPYALLPMDTPINLPGSSHGAHRRPYS
ncbi:Methyltransferase type 11 [Trinorchestia longiramus]|nr:Methyltransferase type 11 [Trinorchestia longiramus]